MQHVIIILYKLLFEVAYRLPIITFTHGIKNTIKWLGLTIRMYFPIMSASCAARFVCKESLTPEATCIVQVPDLELLTATMSSRGKVSRIIRSPLLLLLISLRPWCETAICWTSGCCCPIWNYNILVKKKKKLHCYFYLQNKSIH